MFEAMSKEEKKHLCDVSDEGEGASLLFCKICGKLLAPRPDSSYFTVLGMRDTFPLNLQDLEKNYLARQRLLHPDQFVLKSEEERFEAQEHTILLNEAYRTLKSPSLRGYHLLSLKKKKEDVFDKTQDPLFLMNMMEEREQMEALNTQNDIKEASNRIKEHLQGLEKEMGEAFDVENLQKASQLLDHFQYRLQLYKLLQAKLL
ncbi:MAG TPA: Fe-S protein assembly co-chaperone HscB [Alphaproteobacteria bacterium]|nr:Fe-S protein assembly co-chaperone HscB [Alphaproteobacteria bacterium]